MPTFCAWRIVPEEGGSYCNCLSRYATVCAVSSLPASRGAAVLGSLGIAVLISSAFVSVAFCAETGSAPVELPAMTVQGDRFERPPGFLPESHAVLTANEVRTEAAADAFALLDRVANTSVGFARNTPFSLRGVGNDSVTPGLLGRVAQVATVHCDDIAMTPSQVDFFTPTLWDVASVSVFRGPISTSHGVNALIGGLFLNYAAPEFRTTGRARIFAAEYATREAAVMQNLPLVDQRLAARVAIEHRASDGGSRNVTRQVDDWTGFQQDHVRGLLRWQPQGDDALRVDLLLRHERSDLPNGAMIRALPGGAFFDRVADANEATDAHGESGLAALTVRRHFSAESSLASITAWQRTKTGNTFDLDFTARPLGSGVASQAERSLSQQVEWRGAFARVRWLGGGFLERARHQLRYRAALKLPGLPSTSTNATDIEMETAAIFGQALWQVADHWTIETGLRAHHEHRDVSFDNRNDGFGVPTQGEAGSDVLSPRLSVAWAPRSGTQVGALVSHGFRGGGISGALLRAQTRAYGPEHAWNYEGFLRQQSCDGRGWLQANVYAMDWRHQQVSTTVPGGMPGLDDLVFNAGRSRLHGFECEAGWQWTPRWHVSATVGHAATRFVQFVDAGQNHAGESFPNAPRWSGSASLRYGAAGATGLFGSGTFTWRDSTYSLIGLREFSALEARSLLSGRCGWRWRNGLSVFVQGDNLLDDDFAYARIDRRIFGVAGPLGRASQPRTLGIGAEMTW